MPYSLANPYTPMTPIGAGLENIALALFNGKQADTVKQALQAQQGGAFQAHADLYREQAGKARAERMLAERLYRDQSPDAQDELIAASAGVPSYTVRGYRDTLAGSNPGRTVEDYAAVAPAIRRGMLAVRPAYADKTINPVNIAQALDVLGTTDTRNSLIGDKPDAKKVAQAFFATSGKAPYAGSETGTTNLLTGDQTLNEIGTGRAGRERAQARNFNAQAAGHELEARTGVRIGPPVVVNDPESGVIYTAPSAAVNRQPGVNPNSAGARPAKGGDGSSTTETDIKPIKATGKDADLLLGAIYRSAGGELADSTLTSPIMERAQTYFGTPGSPYYGNHEASARAAVQDIVPGGFASGWISSKVSPKGQLVLNPPPIQITGPTKTSKTVTKGGAAAPSTGTPASAQPAPAKVGRPAGKSDQQLIEEANAAIKAGKDRAAVIARLKAWGVQVD